MFVRVVRSYLLRTGADIIVVINHCRTDCTETQQSDTRTNGTILYGVCWWAIRQYLSVGISCRRILELIGEAGGGRRRCDRRTNLMAGVKF